ncbi:MAG: hypothetical protein Q7K57_37395 [Burkholderiaceae bacterium]|nr:hypothetical protein [Burkholderiaceae bacterium]
MSPQQTEAQERMASAATRKADDLSLKLFNLTEIVKLASFAAEARRVLEGIKAGTAYNPDMQKVIDNCSACPHTWMEMDDSTGNVLDFIGRELGAINIGFTEAVYDLANGKAGNAEQIGGAS